MARTVVSGSWKRRATWTAAALSQALLTVSSNRLLNGALDGNCSIFSTSTPHSGQGNRCTSTITVARYTLQGKSRIARSRTSCTRRNRRPHPLHSDPRSALRRTHKVNVFSASSISCRYTRYPGQARIAVNSLFVKHRAYPTLANTLIPEILSCFHEFLRRANVTMPTHFCSRSADVNTPVLSTAAEWWFARDSSDNTDNYV